VLKKRVLVVDDQINTLKVLEAILQDEGYEVIKAQSGEQALALFRDPGNVDLVLADLKMVGMDGLELYQKIRALEKDLPFLIMTAHGTIQSAVQAMKEGVTNYLIKPLNYEEMNLIIQRALREREMSQELATLRREIQEKYSFQNIIGISPRMKEIFEMVQTVAPTNATILINGETGTGKELLARAIHSLSPRRDRNMICINSAALTESLLEAELFGYRKGAFTGALTDKKGRLELAEGGTLFLDEIGQMSLNLQAKLLRFLQERTFEPVGGLDVRSVDVRLISATNRNLSEEIRAGRFLSDLFYRIEVISITLPPLRDRREDIPLLVDHFIRRYTHQYKNNLEGVDPKAMDILIQHTWPGNVRELENCLARAVILSKGPLLQPLDLSVKFEPEIRTPPLDPGRNRDMDLTRPGMKIKDLERNLIQRTLRNCEGNKTEAAKLLGISRKALYEKMEKFGVSF
jgi:DNA-binding NtrC family response regulator